MRLRQETNCFSLANVIGKRTSFEGAERAKPCINFLTRKAFVGSGMLFILCFALIAARYVLAVEKLFPESDRYATK